MHERAAVDLGKGVDRRQSSFRQEKKFQLAVNPLAGGAMAQAVSGLL